jgi:acyl carrier protein
MVRFGLATHLRVELKDLHNGQRLREDLGLEPIDLVWIAMRVEALVSGVDHFPVEPLLNVETVGDLVSAFDAWATAHDG